MQQMHIYKSALLSCEILDYRILIQHGGKVLSKSSSQATSSLPEELSQAILNKAQPDGGRI